MIKTRIAVVGAGLMGRRHIELVSAHPRCALSAVADPAPAAAEVAAKSGAPHVLTLDRLLAGERPDGVILATPNDLHVEQALACLDAGLPTLLEKSIAATPPPGPSGFPPRLQTEANPQFPDQAVSRYRMKKSRKNA